ncbi:protein disulfide-isomerase A3-like [Watersipora subatra]|uniref:protein disulfide-isomerase A3-like n=1 Tax=Watersipora subatra TaxID=2589382 RepID=UPI00355AFBBB
MRFLIALSLFAVAFASDVLELSDSDFASQLADKEIALVEFFAPWCGHCKKLAPEYEKAATSLLAADPPVPLAKVDCTANTDVCGKYGVSGYPTLKIFRSGELAEDYNGPREADGIVKYMKTKSGPTSKDLASLEVAEKFFKFPEAAFVGFFDDDDSSLAKSFKKAADAMAEKYRFGHSTNADVTKKYGSENKIVLFYPTVMHNKFEDKTVEYDGAADVQSIKSFVTKNAFGFCGHRTTGNSGEFTAKPLVVVYYDVDYVKNAKGTNYWRNRVMKVGKKLVDDGKKLNFAVSNAEDFRGELDEYGLSYSGSPVVAVRDAKNKKFIMSDEFSMDNFEKFLNDFLDGKLEEYLKSEDVPDNSGNAVKVVVAKNFDEIVNDPERDVLIEFYAPWCGHCKSLEPKYKELAEKFADEDGITIAKMDATANDVPSGYEVRGFPTIYFAPKGKKSSPKKYESGREVADFVKYLAAQATDELKGFDRKGKERKTDL